ncbi:MAG TPA: hypothetical protein GXZ28_08460 [Clostridiales bacterium]|jgi:hypothetical protein|nr:hypothetical protein [Clostridiales bacterium]
MDPFQIILIILGIIIIVLSCRIVDKSQYSVKEGTMVTSETLLSENELEMIKGKVNEVLDGICEEAIVRTDDHLDKISNEKIIAVSEFSDQVLEKINRNHEEVVFLYNMLCEKNKELKETVKEIDYSKKMVADFLQELNPSSENSNETPPKISINSSAEETDNEDANFTQLELKLDRPDKMARGSSSYDSSYNKRILNLHSQGLSVLEISKELGLGQGEVRLVIDLHQLQK